MGHNDTGFYRRCEALPMRAPLLLCWFTDLVSSHSFAEFDEIVSGRSHTITHKWMINLETHVEYLSFRIGDHTYPTHCYDEALGAKSAIDWDDFDHVLFCVKRQCKKVAQRLIAELEVWFPNIDPLNALGIVHCQFWVKEGVEESFGFHMATIKQHLCELRWINAGGVVGDTQKFFSL